MSNTYVEIDLKNLKKNFLNIRKKSGKCKVMAVVKADAYGHGMEGCVKALMELGKKAPDYFGVAHVEEGIELRKLTKVNKPVLCFSPMPADKIGLYQKYDLIASVSDESHFYELLALNLKRPLKIHFNVDTGMGLTGIPYEKAYDLIQLIAFKKNIVIDGLYTIFANAFSRDISFARAQIKKVDKLVSRLKKAGVECGIVHAANSAALLNVPGSAFGMVRTGSSLYGFYPSKEVKKSVKIYPVMSIYSSISVVKRLHKGETVGFGRTFKAPADINMATIPFGYADGFKKGFSNNFSAIIKGKFYPQIGNVSMDRIAFNLENDKILKGEKVVLLGKGGNLQISLWDWADRLDTIPYEIACSIGKRIPRIFKK